jgi:hypothetical protein
MNFKIEPYLPSNNSSTKDDHTLEQKLNKLLEIGEVATRAKEWNIKTNSDYILAERIKKEILDDVKALNTLIDDQRKLMVTDNQLIQLLGERVCLLEEKISTLEKKKENHEN